MAEKASDWVGSGLMPFRSYLARPDPFYMPTYNINRKILSAQELEKYYNIKTCKIKGLDIILYLRDRFLY